MWADIDAWFRSAGGARVLQTAIVPALAVLVAGVLAALIARGAMRATLRRADREQAATAVAGLVEAARAAGDVDGSRGDRRRAARLRTEADVRVRLLPLKGAERAADWASVRTDELVAGTAGEHAVPAMRDALIAWVASPRRARKLFPATTAPSPSPSPSPVVAVAAATAGPQRPPAAARAADDGTPAWQRTASAERLRRQTARSRDEEPARDDTAPVRVPRSHRADLPPIAEVEQPERAEAQQETHVDAQQPARPDAQQPARHATAAVGVQEERPSRPEGTPEWLDVYDDEAQVTQQNMDLRTPPPVSATSVRDRAPGGDIVPRP